MVIICCALLAASASASAQQIYRWVDNDGVVHYSDQPRSDAADRDAETVDIKVPPGISNPSRVIAIGGSVDEPADTPPGDAAEDAYRNVTIASPSEQQVVWNIATRLPVEVTVDPPLAGTHRIQILLDDQPIGDPVVTTSTTVEPVYRGEHRISAMIIDQDGNTVSMGPPTTFYVQQASVNRR
jgi:hypothetical protein